MARQQAVLFVHQPSQGAMTEGRRSIAWSANRRLASFAQRRSPVKVFAGLQFAPFLSHPSPPPYISAMVQTTTQSTRQELAEAHELDELLIDI